MSEYVDGSHRSKTPADKVNIESRLMFGACFVLFFLRAVVRRLVPLHGPAAFDRSRNHESIFAEARNQAGTTVTSSFMGL